MNLHLTSSGIPEMAHLSKAQRRFVQSQCLFWLFHRVAYRVGSFALMFGYIIAGSQVIEKWGLWTGGVLVVASVLLINHLYDMIWIAHWRPEVKQFIQVHAAEIKGAV